MACSASPGVLGNHGRQDVPVIAVGAHGPARLRQGLLAALGEEVHQGGDDPRDGPVVGRVRERRVKRRVLGETRPPGRDLARSARRGSASCPPPPPGWPDGRPARRWAAPGGGGPRRGPRSSRAAPGSPARAARPGPRPRPPGRRRPPRGGSRSGRGSRGPASLPGRTSGSPGTAPRGRAPAAAGPRTSGARRRSAAGSAGRSPRRCGCSAPAPGSATSTSERRRATRSPRGSVARSGADGARRYARGAAPTRGRRRPR